MVVSGVILRASVAGLAFLATEECDVNAVWLEASNIPLVHDLGYLPRSRTIAPR